MGFSIHSLALTLWSWVRDLFPSGLKFLISVTCVALGPTSQGCGMMPACSALIPRVWNKGGAACVEKLPREAISSSGDVLCFTPYFPGKLSLAGHWQADSRTHGKLQRAKKSRTLLKDVSPGLMANFKGSNGAIISQTVWHWPWQPRPPTDQGPSQRLTYQAKDTTAGLFLKWVWVNWSS